MVYSSSKNITQQFFVINKDLRSKRLDQKPLLFWFTGLSGSGKSTLSNAFEKKLFNEGFMTYSLDGDNLRSGLCNNLGFSYEDRIENIRRTGEVCKLMLDAGLIVCASFVSPYKKDREFVKKIIGKKNFVEIYVSTPIQVCEERDVKGLYKMARDGKISNFTGISAPYEAPIKPDIEIDTSMINLEDAVNKIYKFLNLKQK